MADVNTSTSNEDGSTTVIHNDLQFPQELNIFGAGTLGEHVSYWSELTVAMNPDGSAGIEIEHAHLSFDSPFGPEDAVHFRLGRFMPNLVDGFQEMQLATDAGIDSLFGYNPIGAQGGTGLGEEGAGISIPTLSNGVEAYGIIRHRAVWVAGLVNGLGPSPTDTTGRFDGNNAKDVYARFDYKIGGMGLDGDTRGRPVPDRNWRDNSLRLGAFTYRGDGTGINFPTAPLDGLATSVQDTHFLRTGLYASLFVRDLNIFGAFIHGSDALEVFDGATDAPVSATQPSYHSWFAQADVRDSIPGDMPPVGTRR